MGVNTDPRLVLGNVSRAFDSEGGGPGSLTNKAIISLVNVEEDRLSKQQENYTKTDKGISYKAPPVYINVYILIAINRTEYAESLRWLSYVIQYFQHQSVFTPLSHPLLEGKAERLIVDLHSLNFEQVNHLWSTLGGKYLPSVLYKVRQVTIDEDIVTGEAGFITEIQMNNETLLPLS